MTMATDTAVVTELGNAPVAAEAPPVEPVEVQLPETATPEGSEPAAESTTPETEAPDPLAGLDDAALLAHPRIRDRLARETESVRRRSERDTETRIQSARANWVASGQAFSDVQAALADGNTQQAQTFIDAALANRDWSAVAALDRIGRAKLPEGKVAVEDQNRLDEAMFAAQRGTGTLDAYADTLIEVRAKAYAENVLAPQIEQRLTREAAAKARAAAKTASVQAAEATNATSGRPTLGVPGRGTAAVGITTAELDAIPTEVWRNKPSEERARLLAEARANDARTR